jgi:hypothetical protein
LSTQTKMLEMSCVSKLSFSTCIIIHLKDNFKAGVVPHACNPSYSRGRDQENWGSKPVGKKLARPHLTETAQCGENRVRCLTEGLTFKWPESRHMKSYLKNNQSQKKKKWGRGGGRGQGSSDRVLI